MANRQRMVNEIKMAAESAVLKNVSRNGSIARAVHG
jgi:hypothetical protein